MLYYIIAICTLTHHCTMFDNLRSSALLLIPSFASHLRLWLCGFAAVVARLVAAAKTQTDRGRDAGRAISSHSSKLNAGTKAKQLK